ncbi:MAG: hypothetical protein HYY48_03295 [Gammaproteobacteria bacterium]|nr:hypothetical protein [Gammaproteobacteria bacterium]
MLRSRPAPIQVLYIGYPGTSGLPEVDYLIADQRVCPPEHDRFYTERVARLPRSFWCFAPPEAAPSPAEAPVGTNGHVTFGSYNALQKLSDTTVRLWSRLLEAAPGTRLLLKSLSFADDAVRGVVEKRFVDAGVAGGRVITVPPTDKKNFYAEYSHLDIALDPMPYNGGTTTCEALWMGVPVVALRGDMFRGRMSASILEILGLPELAARTEEEYVHIAAALASDVPRIQALHREVRGRMAASSICDDAGMARDLEGLYRKMWKRWLEESR